MPDRLAVLISYLRWWGRWQQGRVGNTSANEFIQTEQPSFCPWPGGSQLGFIPSSTPRSIYSSLQRVGAGLRWPSSKYISKNSVWSGVGGKPRVSKLGYVPGMQDLDSGLYGLVVSSSHLHQIEEQGLGPRAQHLIWSWVQGLGEFKQQQLCTSTGHVVTAGQPPQP